MLIKAIKKPDDRWACTYANKNMEQYWDSFYKYYDSIMYSYLPLSTMLVFNVAIVTKLVVAKMKRSSDTVGGTSLSKTSHSVTVMLVCIIVTIVTIVTLVPILAIVTKLVVAKMKRNSDIVGGTSVTVMLVCSIADYFMIQWNSF